MTVANCGSEASLVWDAIQPHGALLVLQGLELRVVRASVNASALLGLPSVLERAVTDCFSESAANFLQELVELAAGQFRMGDLESLAREPLYATAHHPLDSDAGSSEATLILEIEPLASARPTLLASDRATLYTALAHLRRASGPEALLQAATAEVQRLTQYEHVLAYRFDATGAGAVVAESLGSTAGESYLGLHYPASDIPAAARTAYQHCFLRYIPNFSAEAVPLIATEAVATEAEPTDPDRADSLSLALLRQPSSCCIEYHQNMGVEALLVLPLLQAGELWGLLTCHHSTPRPLDPAIRADCELFGQFVALELTNQQTRSERAYEEYLQTLRTEAIAALARTKDLHGTLLSPKFRLLGLTEAAGAAVCLDGKISLLGATPARSAVRALLTWAESYLGEDENLLATHTLSALYPAAAEFADTASGLVLLQISRTPRWAILWFRPEIPQTITWAGNPHTGVHPKADGSLGPRASFARWQEVNRGTAKPWQLAELQSARELRNAIVGLVLQKLDDLERSNQELASFAFAASHDLKEPLRGIHNYAAFLLEDYADRLDETGRDRLQVLMRLSQRMESLIDVLLRYSRLGQTELNAEPTDL
ncbi:MAG: GAF domain-containing protein, partial [Cyanobacteria bacterium J06641_5]